MKLSKSSIQRLTITSALLLSASSLFSQVNINSNNSDHEVKSMTVTNTGIGADVSSSTSLSYGSGSFTGGTIGDVFGVTTVLASNFDIAAANAAISGGTFEAYIAGLTAGSGSGNIINATQSIFGADTTAQNDPVVAGYIDGDITRLSQVGEALIWTYDTSGLNSNTQLFLVEMKTGNFNVGNATDAYDMIVWNTMTDIVKFSRSAATDDFDFSDSPILLGDGDILVIGSNVDGATFRVGPGIYDLASIPEPSTSVMLFSAIFILTVLNRKHARPSK